MIDEARKYQAFYTKSTPIVDYMVSKLMLKPTDRVLEPCAGDGVFVDALLEKNEFSEIDVCELNRAAVDVLKNKFSNYKNIRIKECDTLLDNELSFHSNFGGCYDKIIANPPYGAWLDMGKKGVLQKMYPHLYLKESYALFLFRCIELLKDGGILSFIIPDTFLNLHSHKILRQYVLTKTKIMELALFPSSFFPGVNFGYANLSIITLQKSFNPTECLNNPFNAITNFSCVEQLSNTEKTGLKFYLFTQKEIFSNADHAFFIAEDSNIAKKINNTNLKIGDIAQCVTGFYSGNDKIFLKALNHELKNGKNYGLVDIDAINKNHKDAPKILDGISGDKYFIPILKGGNTKYLKPENWFMDWGKEAVSHYKKDKKSRFQNPKYYFKFGIGVPMVSSSSITASLIQNQLFDQSIVGIFPKDETLTYYLLAFFNSPTCNKLIRTINPSVNNPANYIKKIPFIIPSMEDKELIETRTKEILKSIETFGSYDIGLELASNNIFESIYGF